VYAELFCGEVVGRLKTNVLKLF